MKTLGKIFAVFLTAGIFYAGSALFSSAPIGSDLGNKLAFFLVGGVVVLIILAKKLK
ncbi:uncharacterized protein METZ01_LOCUS373822 [marine metagenome]|jgi:hypothetical protein|uniref:Uncharacterized protein n=1 Tax=marine metagenome TaxID=408172 RepID=A0A382THT1_9ZZZZ|tara:strand:- start:140 stop:310 length:171 start_codon:yes stop_codon:yes gene_type:complete